MQKLASRKKKKAKMRVEDYRVRLTNLWDELNHFSQNPQLIAVSKYVDPEEVGKCYEAGQKIFGENRIEQLEEKSDYLKDDCPDIEWHFIGRIQSNKIKRILKIPNLKAIHSVAQQGHLEEINKHAKKPIEIFIQVNTTAEEQKEGVTSFKEAEELVKLITNSKVKFAGLMTMGAIDSSPDQHLECFHELALMASKFEKNLALSMGMTGDYQQACSAGANYVRIGSAVFK